jgi:hypothetical protein
VHHTVHDHQGMRPQGVHQDLGAEALRVIEAEDPRREARYDVVERPAGPLQNAQMCVLLSTERFMIVSDCGPVMDFSSRRHLRY